MIVRRRALLTLLPPMGRAIALTADMVPEGVTPGDWLIISREGKPRIIKDRDFQVIYELSPVQEIGPGEFGSIDNAPPDSEKPKAAREPASKIRRKRITKPASSKPEPIDKTSPAYAAWYAETFPGIGTGEPWYAAVALGRSSMIDEAIFESPDELRPVVWGTGRSKEAAIAIAKLNADRLPGAPETWDVHEINEAQKVIVDAGNVDWPIAHRPCLKTGGCSGVRGHNEPCRGLESNVWEDRIVSEALREGRLVAP